MIGPIKTKFLWITWFPSLSLYWALTTQALKANCDVPLAKMVLALRFKLISFYGCWMDYSNLCQICFASSWSSLHVIATLFVGTWALRWRWLYFMLKDWGGTKEFGPSFLRFDFSWTIKSVSESLYFLMSFESTILISSSSNKLHIWA